MFESLETDPEEIVHSGTETDFEGLVPAASDATETREGRIESSGVRVLRESRGTGLTSGLGSGSPGSGKAREDKSG